MVISFGYGGIPENALLQTKWKADISKIVKYWEDYKSAKGFTLITKISFFAKICSTIVQTLIVIAHACTIYCLGFAKLLVLLHTVRNF